MDDYRVKMNSRSKDGFAGLKVARRQKGESLLLYDCLYWLRRTTQQRDAIALGAVLALVFMAFLRGAVHMLGLRVPDGILLLA